MAISSGAFSDFGSAVSDIFGAQGDELKAQGEQFEQQRYEEASALATQNEQFTQMSTQSNKPHRTAVCTRLLARPRPTLPVLDLPAAAAHSTCSVHLHSREQRLGPSSDTKGELRRPDSLSRPARTH